MGDPNLDARMTPGRALPRRTDSSSSNSRTGSETEADSETDAPSLSRIFVDAARYEELLVPNERPGAGAADDDGESIERKGFEELVGRDLGPSEHAIAGRLARLSVTSLDAGSAWTGDAEMRVVDEPESYQDDDGGMGAAMVQSGASPTSSLSGTTRVDEDGFGPESWKLAPERVVELVVQEFGALASPNEEEVLLLEADAALLVLDVIIIGVVHLTTHRLTFHASLLAARPDLLPAHQVVKAGPAVLHRKGLHPKRRVWLELSHDMICTYNTGDEKDRIHPFRTVLLSSVKDVSRADPKNPRFIHIYFQSKAKDEVRIVEFTTEEAAHDWRRELQAALFLYRRRRKQVLDVDSVEASTGVRVNIPLHYIQDVSSESHHFQITCLTSPDMPLSLMDPGNVDSTASGSPLRDDASDGEDLQTFRLQLCPVTPPVDQWPDLGQHIAAAKERHRREQALQPPEDLNLDVTSPVVADFGPLSFAEQDLKVIDSQFISNEERAVRESLALEDDLDLLIVKARVRRGIVCWGHFVVSPHVVGFWSKVITHSDIRYRIAISTVKRAKPSNLKLCFRNGMTLEVEGHSDLRFEFKTAEIRDETIRRINGAVRIDRETRSPDPTPPPSSSSSSCSSWPTSSSLASTPTAVSFLSDSSALPSPNLTRVISPIRRTISVLSTTELPKTLPMNHPKAINVPRGVLLNRPSLHFVCLTIGSRGDVQPYIALGLRLKREGHRVTIVTHEEYREWVEGFGIAHRPAGGDPTVLMKLSVDNKMFSPDFFKESLGKFRPWLDQLLEDAWAGCQGADVLLESPSAMAGVHISEALKIPYFRTFTMPWTKTTQFPHAFLSPPVNAPTFNSLSYVLFDNVMWAATSGQINRWRRNTLKLDATDMGHLAQSKITFIYNFSPAVVPKPLDWGDTTVISGYWFLDNPELNWVVPPSLIEWMKKARTDGKPIVYIGFGSVTVPHPNRTTRNIIKAVLKSDVRAIISKGWSARLSKDNDEEVEMPPECYQLDKVPHDWLFPRIDAALHHGGAGTTGASLRAGIPTLIKPWFGDQFFWASRVQQLGTGLRVPSLRVSHLATALTTATTSRIMKERAASVGERIRSEDGIHTAISTIYTYLSRAGKDRRTLD